MRMAMIARVARDHWANGDRDGARSAAERENDAIEGYFAARSDLEFEWPENGGSELVIVFHPDPAKGLTDARLLEFKMDLNSGEHETSEYYPASFRFVAFALIGVLAGGIFLLVRWGARPFCKPGDHEGRVAALHMGGEWEAMQMMARIRNRE